MNQRIFNWKNWTIKEEKSHILKLEGDERNAFENDVKLNMYPDMIFNKNTLEIEYKNVFKFQFNVKDALRMVNEKSNDIQVASADVWKEANAHIIKHCDDKDAKEVDWTFTTNYKGTIIGNCEVEKFNGNNVNAINYDILKNREDIRFFSELTLYEDELGDNGTAECVTRLRVMDSGWFLLYRFYLRVDNRKLRVYDVRLCSGAAIGSNDKIVREVRFKESSGWTEKMSGINMHDAEPLCDIVLESYSEILTPSTE